MRRARVTVVDPDQGELIGTTTFAVAEAQIGEAEFTVEFEGPTLPPGTELVFTVRVRSPADGEG